MPKTTDKAEARKRAQALVAQVKQRIAKQEGVTEPVHDGDEDAPRSAEPAHVTRAQAHPAARTQRPQGRREGK